jgi:hypothetical protein
MGMRDERGLNELDGFKSVSLPAKAASSSLAADFSFLKDGANQ